jgi:hypothetical protein
MTLTAAARIKRVATVLTGVAIVYGNLAVAFDSERIGLGSWPSLPAPSLLRDAFLLPGVFGGYAVQSFDYVLLGRRSDTGRVADRGEIITLPLAEHFPLRDAISYAQLFAPRHLHMYGSAGQREALGFLAQRIKANHARLHPDAPLAALRIGVVSFPQSSSGYRAAKTEQTSWLQIVYAEP